MNEVQSRMQTTASETLCEDTRQHTKPFGSMFSFAFLFFDRKFSFAYVYFSTEYSIL